MLTLGSADGFTYFTVGLVLVLIASVVFVFSLRSGVRAADSEPGSSGKGSGGAGKSRGKSPYGVEKDVHSIHENRGRRRERTYRVPVDSIPSSDEFPDVEEIHYQVVAEFAGDGAGRESERTVARVPEKETREGYIEITIPVSLGKPRRLKILGPGDSTLGTVELPGRAPPGETVELSSADVRTASLEAASAGTDRTKSVEYTIPQEALPDSGYYFISAVGSGSGEELIQQREVGGDSEDELVIQVRGETNIQALEGFRVYERDSRRGRRAVGEFRLPGKKEGEEMVGLSSRDFQELEDTGGTNPLTTTFLLPDRLFPDAASYLIITVDPEGAEINRRLVEDPGEGSVYEIDAKRTQSDVQEVQVYDGDEVRLGTFEVGGDYEQGGDVSLGEEAWTVVPESERTAGRSSTADPGAESDLRMTFDLADRLLEPESGYYQVNIHTDAGTKEKPLWDFPEPSTVLVSEGEPRRVEVVNGGTQIGRVPLDNVDWTRAREDGIVLDRIEFTFEGGVFLRLKAHETLESILAEDGLVVVSYDESDLDESGQPREGAGPQDRIGRRREVEPGADFPIRASVTSLPVKVQVLNGETEELIGHYRVDSAKLLPHGKGLVLSDFELNR